MFSEVPIGKGHLPNQHKQEVSSSRGRKSRGSETAAGSREVNPEHGNSQCKGQLEFGQQLGC